MMIKKKKWLFAQEIIDRDLKARERKLKKILMSGIKR